MNTHTIHFLFLSGYKNDKPEYVEISTDVPNEKKTTT